jgi:tetrapyrrole methylase family protein/MazG family protein
VHGEVVYAVPGSPLVAERTVVLLQERAATGVIDLAVLPALSFAELVWARLGVDPLAAGVRLVDGHRFAVEAAGERGPLLVGQCDRRDVLSDIKLDLDLDGPPVTVVQRLGLPDEVVFEVAREDLDRSFEPDHLTSLYLSSGAPAVASEVARFDELVHHLRLHCPWDREQTHQSLTRHLLEETYEVLEAIAALDPAEPASYGHLEEELGDLLFQVVFHATLAAEEGWFDLADVARGIHHKLRVRHPHVFGEAPETDLAGLSVDWERRKRAEKGRASVFDGIPATLPALLHALKVIRKAASLEVVLPVPEGLPVVEAALGDALLDLVAACRAAEVDPEQALRGAAGRLMARAQQAEQA